MNFISFTRTDGNEVLVPTNTPPTVLFSQIKRGNGSVDAISLVFPNNLTVQIVGETRETILAKFDAGFGTKTHIFGNEVIPK